MNHAQKPSKINNSSHEKTSPRVSQAQKLKIVRMKMIMKAVKAKSDLI